MPSHTCTNTLVLASYLKNIKSPEQALGGFLICLLRFTIKNVTRSKPAKLILYTVTVLIYFYLKDVLGINGVLGFSSPRTKSLPPRKDKDMSLHILTFLSFLLDVNRFRSSDALLSLTFVFPPIKFTPTNHITSRAHWCYVALLSFRTLLEVQAVWGPGSA